MLNQFPRRGKIISVMLLIVIGLFLYQWYKDEHQPLQPGTNEYFFIHYNDSLDASWKDDSAPTVIGHYWYKDSNNVWHEDNDRGRTDSSHYEK